MGYLIVRGAEGLGYMIVRGLKPWGTGLCGGRSLGVPDCAGAEALGKLIVRGTDFVGATR